MKPVTIDLDKYHACVANLLLYDSRNIILFSKVCKGEISMATL
jgi:hypothetical protein